MTDLILHQYRSSPFSEKIRCLLGYKELSYKTVEIPVIMPKPDLMALTGGYRKTPAYQRGADIYCDTAIICRFIEEICPAKPVYSSSKEAALSAAAHWTDTFLFRVSVAVAFQPKALAASELLSDPAAAEAFMRDRADFTAGSTALGMELEVAVPHWLAHISKLNTQLSGSAFLGGSTPDILDFSTYHCCWLVYSNPLLEPELEAFPDVARWMKVMGAFSSTETDLIDGEAAVAIASSSEFLTPATAGTIIDPDLVAGASVEVLPIDYGFQPTQGELIVASNDSIVIKRSDERACELLVHFPRIGFEIRKSAE